jgi:transcriptional regulator with XRE-family HTH domain
MSLGSTIRKLRTMRGMTLSELALKTNSQVGNISKIERDIHKPNIDFLYKIAGALDYSVTDIFRLSDISSEQKNDEVHTLNAIFVTLLESDQELLIQFAKLLKERGTNNLRL